ncbi:transcriptional regulator [Rufibacter sp. DG15C]|uniref:response regulator n=1 Tax=Rufibacter sp. DG15C TaxID=1379909 RepID=UPI00078B309A|nr:response regulator [Rufibacter sp. DG15C]AMM51588.1 transcriptional regulator [Rufibacter sp. DG15C]
MKKRILIIEDNVDIRESSTEILELSGYEVLAASDGRAGVDLALDQVPDLILCDIMMPEMDGIGVLYLLHKNPVTANIPFVFLTAKAERVDIRKGMEMGADDYLTKPFDDMELLVAVESQLAKKQQQQAFYSQPIGNIDSLAGGSDGLTQLKNTIAGLKVRQVKKDQSIYQEEDHAKGIYLVMSGRFKTSQTAEDGRELITGLFTQSDYMGIEALLLGEPYTDNATAMENSSMCLLTKETVDSFLARFTDIGQKFIQLLSQNIREKETQLLQMAYHSVRKRMANVLVSLAQDQPKLLVQDGLQVSREDMASMAGMANETVSRILSDFTTEKLILKKGRLIQILDLPRLTNMKN